MKAKLNFKSKRTIIIIAIIAILAIVAGVAGYFYMKSDDTVGATNNGDNSSTSISSAESQDNEDNNGSDATSTSSNEQSSTDGVNNDGQQAGTAGETGANDATNGNGAQGTNNGATGTTDTTGTTTTGTTAAGQNGATTENANAGADIGTIYEQVTENVVTEQPWETHDVKWEPEQLKVSTLESGEVSKSEILLNKTATTEYGYSLVNRGEKITYTITVTNNEDKVLNSLYISDKIPEGTTFDSIDEIGETVTDSENNVTKVVWDLWNLGLNKGDSITVSFVVAVNEDATGTITNTALVEGEETNPTQNSILTGEKTSEITRNGDKVTDGKAKVGDKITYKITAYNNGDIEGTTVVKDQELKKLVDDGILVIDEKDEESTKIAEALTGDGIELTIEKNSSEEIIFTAIVNSISGAIKNTAQIGNEDIENTVKTVDYNVEKKLISYYDASAKTTVEVTDENKANIKVDLNDVLTYEVKVTNNGSETLNNIIVTDSIVFDENGNLVEETIDSIAPGESETVTFEYTVDEDDIKAGAVTNTATATPDGEDPTETEEPVVVPTEDEDTTIVVEKKLISYYDASAETTVEVTDENRADVEVGLNDVLTYEVKVTNNGNVTVEDITVTDSIVFDENGNLVEETIDSIAPGESKSVTFEYTVDEDDIKAGAVTNTATATPDGEEQTETEEPVVVPTEDEDTTIVVEKKLISYYDASAETTVEVTDENREDVKVDLDDVLTYEVTVTNNGNITVEEITVTDSIVFDEDGNLVEKTIDSIAPGESKSVTFEYTVDEDDIKAGAVTNTATATPDGEEQTETEEPVVVPTEDEDTTIVVEKKLISYYDASEEETVEVTDENRADVEVGLNDVLTYEVKVTNNGNVTVEDITVTDSIVFDENGNLVEETIDSIAPGESETVTFEYTVVENDIKAGAVTNTATATPDGEDSTETEEPVVVPTEDEDTTIVVEKKLISYYDASAETTVEVTDENRADVKVDLNDVLAYEVKVTNNGNVTIEDITVTDSIVFDENGNLVEETIDSIAPGESETVTFEYTVVENDIKAGAVTNTATATPYGEDPTETEEPVVVPTIDHISIDVEKIWNDNENAYEERPDSIEVTLYADNELLDTAEITAENDWKYTFDGLDIYNENGREIEYTIEEKEVEGYTANYEGYTITNTYNNVTVRKQSIASSSTTEETTTNDVDVVFILDVSGSMEQNNMTGTKTKRAKAMVDATNSAITQIMKNPNNRISVVMYSDDVNSQPELSLSKSYTPKSKTSDGVGEYLKYNDGKIKTNVNQKSKQSSKAVEGATYTQLGIAKGANVLVNATETSNRTPVIILLTDGEPTYGTTNYNNVTSTYNMGQGNTIRMTNEEIGAAGYLTVLTANYYKNLVSKNYIASPLMYTIGIGMSGIYCETTLDPSEENVNKCQNSTTAGASDLYKYLKGKKTAVPLKSEGKTNVSNPYKNYDYADGSWSGSMDEKTLKQILERITESITVTYKATETKTSTLVEDTVITLEELDTSKSIIITLDGVATPYEVSKLIEDGVVSEPTDGSTNYTMDLTANMFKDAKIIDIEYFSTATIETDIATASLFSLAIEKANNGEVEQILTALKEDNEEIENSKDNTETSTENSGSASEENNLPEKDVENDTENKENVDENTNTDEEESNTDVDNTTENTDNDSTSSNSDVENSTTNEEQKNNDTTSSKEVLDTDSNDVK